MSPRTAPVRRAGALRVRQQHSTGRHQRMGIVLVLAVFAAGPPALCSAGTLRVTAFDDEGETLDREGLLRFIAPRSRENGQAPAQSGLLISDFDGNPLEGGPWWDEAEQGAVWRWEGTAKARISLPWPIRKDGFSTVRLDARGEGYAGEQKILLNEEIAVNAYHRLQDALKLRSSVWKPTYKPSARAQKLHAAAKATLHKATAEKSLRRRARGFDEALAQISYAWQQMLFEHGRQTLADPKRAERMRWAVTLDERVVDRIREYDWIAERLQKAGVNWVRLVFRANPDDFTFSRPGSLTLYDELIAALQRRKVHVMGSVLDSMLWPRGATPEAYAARTRNLALHYRDKIRSWEVGSESNGDWIGGTENPLPAAVVLDCVRRGAAAVKGVDATLETTATLHWWEGTAPGGMGLWPWLNAAAASGYGQDIDVIGLSVYPDRHPFGIAFDPAFMELKRRFPAQKLMLGGWAYEQGDAPSGYWWLEPKNVKNARADLAILFAAAAAAIPDSVGGGFFWQTLDHMLKPRKRTTSFYRLYRSALKRLTKN